MVYSVGPGGVQCHVFVDFDGTIATVDTTDAILQAFADVSWQEVEAEWKAGRIGSRECLVRQIDLIRASPVSLDAMIATFAIDPHFEAFTSYCRHRGLGLTIVSDGLDRSVGTVLERHGLALPYHANRLEHAGGDRWRLSFPNGRSGCRALAGNCKCAVVEKHQRALKVVIGDGRSDFCMAEAADLVIAKAALLRQCVARDLPHLPFATFADVIGILDGWLAEQGLGREVAGQLAHND